MAIRAVTFDFWGTLFCSANYDERSRIRVDAMVKASGRTPQVVLDALKDVWAAFERCHKEERRTLSPIDAVNMAAAILEVNLERPVVEELAEVFSTTIMKFPPEPIEGALDAVRATADRFPVGLISDTGVNIGKSLCHVLDRFGFLQHFKACVFSDETGVAKPQAIMFETAAGGLHTDVTELLHIGDLEYTDILGARNVGAKAALFYGDVTRYQGPPDKTEADYQFATWREFTDYIPSFA